MTISVYMAVIPKHVIININAFDILHQEQTFKWRLLKFFFRNYENIILRAR